VALLTLLAAIRWAAISGGEPLIPEREITYRPIQVDDDGYVSSRTCKACHPSQYDTWHRSYHRTMTQLATPSTVRANFDDVQVNGGYDKSMSLKRRGNELWAEFDDPDLHGAREEVRRVKRQVVMVTGSHQQQVYWYRTDFNRLLGQLPLMYLVAERRWIPRGRGFLEPPAYGEEGTAPENGGRNAVWVDFHRNKRKTRVDVVLC